MLAAIVLCVLDKQYVFTFLYIYISVYNTVFKYYELSKMFTNNCSNNVSSTYLYKKMFSQTYLLVVILRYCEECIGFTLMF